MRRSHRSSRLRPFAVVSLVAGLTGVVAIAPAGAQTAPAASGSVGLTGAVDVECHADGPTIDAVLELDAPAGLQVVSSWEVDDGAGGPVAALGSLTTPITYPVSGEQPYEDRVIFGGLWTDGYPYAYRIHHQLFEGSVEIGSQTAEIECTADGVPAGVVVTDAPGDPGATPPAQPIVDPVGADTGFAPGPISWAPCFLSLSLGQECADVEVPLDHRNPDGFRATINLVRVPALDPGARIGSVLVNPGGPGGSGVDYALGLGLGSASPEMRRRFDIVGFDPRGVSRSRPAAECAEVDESLIPFDRVQIDWNVTMPAAQAVYGSSNNGCAVTLARFGRLLSTNQIAADMDWIRQALGEDQITFHGGSYGTQIGLTYARHFGENLRALVLDGNADPTDTYTKDTAERGGSFDDAFHRFSATYPESRARFDEIAARLRLGPAQVTIDGDTEELTYGAFLGPVSSGISAEHTWPNKVEWIDQVHAGLHESSFNITALQDFEAPLIPEPIPGPGIDDTFITRSTPGGERSNARSNNGGTILQVVNCIDLPGHPTPDQLIPLAQHMEAQGPIFGASMALALPGCEGLEIPPDHSQEIVPVDSPAPLVVGSVHDPSTPYVWSVRMAEYFPTAGLVTYAGAQHVATAYPALTSLRAIVDEYLVDPSRLPASDTYCPFVRPDETSQRPCTTTGYWLTGGDGGVFTFGSAGFHGSLGGVALNAPVVASAATVTGDGYWLVARDGGVFSFGDAAFHGSTGGIPLNQPVVDLVPTPSGGGYWLVAADGGVFSFGDARFWGSTGGLALNQPIVRAVSSPSSFGYALVASDGGIFTFGDARFWGSTGGMALNQPIVDAVMSPQGTGYQLVARDGGVFTFGTAEFLGSTGNLALNAPILSAAAPRQGHGYWLTGTDGGIFSFGRAPFEGSLGALPLNAPVIDTATR